MTAMLAATVPGANFGDPSRSADPLSASDQGQVGVPAAPQDQDSTSANGADPAS
jgi:hypothetical protein